MPIRAMDGRWLTAYSDRGRVSPYDIFRGWTADAHRMFGQFPEHLRVFADGHWLDDFPWTPNALKRPGLDGRSSLLLVDATDWWGLSVVLERRIDLADTKWTLHAELRDVQLHRARKHVDLASTASLVGAISLVLAVDAERMLRRATETALMPQVAVALKRSGLVEDVRQHVIDPVYKNLRARSVAIEPAVQAPVVTITVVR